MRNHFFSRLALATGGLFLIACSSETANTSPTDDGGSLAPDSGPDQGAPPIDGGGIACCPTAFSMYSCQKPGGGTSFACHNPALGCASSQVCGQGCDPEVSGRCQCVQTVLCAIGDHFDTTQCQCVPAQDGAVSPPVDASPCIDNVLCVVGDHFDATLCKCVPNQDGAVLPPPFDGGGCLDNVLCVLGDHFDSTLCKCVPNQDGAISPPVDAGKCVETVLCIVGDHFDSTLCKCVPSQDGAVSPPADAARCVETVLCIVGDHFDSTLCKCVPNQDAGTSSADGGGLGCTSAKDCTGALPALCEVCGDGGTGCAHFTCVANKCRIAYCP